jgi:protein involved in polysaccharide export with SLBB domain
VRDYVHLAGGANRNADKRHPFVIRADGSVISQDEVGQKKFEAVVIQPGDTIVVSEKTFGPSKLRAFLDFSQLFSQLAIGAAVLNNL